MDSIRAGDRLACIDVESHATPRKVVLCSGESTLFLAFSHNPNSFMCARMSSRCRTANWCDWARINQSLMLFNMRILWRRRGTRAASTHFVKVRGDNARLNRRTRYWYDLPPKATLIGLRPRASGLLPRSFLKNNNSPQIRFTLWRLRLSVLPVSPLFRWGSTISHAL